MIISMWYECIFIIYRTNTQLAICGDKQSIHQEIPTKVEIMVLLYIISLFTCIIIELKRKSIKVL